MLLDKINRFIELSKYFGTDVCKPGSEDFLQVLEDTIGPLDSIKARVKYTNEIHNTYPNGSKRDLYKLKQNFIGSSHEAWVENTKCIILKVLDKRYLIYYSTYGEDTCAGEMKDLYLVNKNVVELI